MKLNTLKSDFILIFVATIWGLAFVAQRIGMDHVGPFTFNGLRFVLGCLSLLPVLFFTRKKTMQSHKQGLLKAGCVSGIFLFLGISFQQVGLVYTTAGKAGFITGLYVVIVPLLNLIFKQDKTAASTWFGAILASIGMYLLSVTKDLSINFGDILIFCSAICFAFHLVIIGRLSNRFNATLLSLIQCMVCALLSLGVAFVFETFVIADIKVVAIPLLYGGILSVGVAYSLQIYAQKNAPTTHAAIIFSLESVVAAIGGWIILNEILSGRGLTGCALMLAGMLISQAYTRRQSI
ncbi:MAG: DMT family transporter [Desulfobacula sp.]|nr:DMT family transporter [Desulfobacula sp.]